MKALTKLAPVALCLLAACASTNDNSQGSTTTAIPEGAWIGDGQEIDQVVRFSVVDANPPEFYDRTVFVEANAFAVCKKMQCWMQIEDEGHWATVRWDSGCGGNYKFPEDAVGDRVVVQGDLYPKELTQEQIDQLNAAGKPVPAEPYEFNVTAVMVIED
jgi:hypothetical protein